MNCLVNDQNKNKKLFWEKVRKARNQEKCPHANAKNLIGFIQFRLFILF